MKVGAIEGYAELLHTQLLSMWGFAERPDMTMLERFRAEYTGKRYSFGYLACPRLEDQAPLFHHPEASYFSVTWPSSAGPGPALRVPHHRLMPTATVSQGWGARVL